MDHDWDSVVEELGPKLFRYFRARYSHEQSSDLTQETLIRLVQKTDGGHFDPVRGNLRMFAYGIAHFVALEAHKRPEVEIEAIADHPVPPKFEEEMFERQKNEKMRKALKELEPVQMQIISLMIDEEMTLVDIGSVLGMPTGTVKSHVHRAKEHLRKLLVTKESV